MSSRANPASAASDSSIRSSASRASPPFRGQAAAGLRRAPHQALQIGAQSQWIGLVEQLSFGVAGFGHGAEMAAGVGGLRPQALLRAHAEGGAQQPRLALAAFAVAAEPEQVFGEPRRQIVVTRRRAWRGRRAPLVDGLAVGRQ
jgi:hypothetical protein